MNICWDNLEKAIFTKKGNWRINNYTYYEKICINCNEIFLGGSYQLFCSYKCCNSGKFNPQFNKKVTKKTRQKMKNSKLKYKTCEENKSWYDTYAHKISFAEETRRALDDENILEVRCKYCGKWYKPTRKQTCNKLNYLLGTIKSESNFYCSEKCKKVCPIFYKSKYPVGFTGDQNSSREVQPELRKMVLERDDYTCQKCGLNSNEQCVELHCHHINPVKLDPIESADIDNCITLCVDCHHEAHEKEGCSTGFLAKCINL